MKVVILCGGQGTRLREETEVRPKPLVEIGGRPILWHIMKLYSHHGFTDFILCLGYKGNLIKEYFLNYEAMNSDFTVRLGPGGGLEFHRSQSEIGWSITLVDTGATAMTGARLKRAAAYLDGPFCLTYGDGVGDVNLRAVVEHHVHQRTIGTVTGVRPPSRFGEIDVDGSKVRAFLEKPQVGSGLINGGFFIFQPEFLDRLSADDGCTLERAPLEELAADEQLSVYQHTGFWQPMDTYRDKELLERLWAEGKAPWKVWK